MCSGVHMCPGVARSVPAPSRTASANARSRPIKKRSAGLRPLITEPADGFEPRLTTPSTDAAHLRAQVRCVEVNRHAVRLEHPHQLVCDLYANAFLHCEAPRENADQSRQLRDADDLFVRDVADVGVAVEREYVMLAQRVELDRSLDDLADAAVRAAVTLGRKGGEELRVAFVSGRRLEQGAQVATRGRAGARRVEVHAEGLEDL